MKMKYKEKTIQSSLGILFSIFLFFSSGIQIPVLDSVADRYFQDSITKAGVSYGVCRLINGTVSVIQQSSVQLEPAGIGMSLAVGQIVDPINDMVERLSDVLVLSITSLGIQELAYEISIMLAPPVGASFLFVLSVLLWFKKDTFFALQKVVLNVLILISIARFCLPVSSLANEFLQEHFFEDKIIEANGKLAEGMADLNTLNEVDVPEYEGVLKTIENSASYIKHKSVDFKNAVSITLENKGLIVENLLKLTFLYLGIFVIQILVLPLSIFWLLMRLVNALFLSNVLTNSTHHSSS
jgi:hypothetical protein